MAIEIIGYVDGKPQKVVLENGTNTTVSSSKSAIQIDTDGYTDSEAVQAVDAGTIDSTEIAKNFVRGKLSYSLRGTGVVAGTYGGATKYPVITVDSKGRITEASEQTLPSSSGTVTSVAALTLGTSGTDLSSSVANPTTTPVITLNVPTASATNRGALSAADWATFNAKQASLGYTPEDVANKQTNLTASATKYPTVDAVNTGLGTKQNTITTGTTAQYFKGDLSLGTFATDAKTAIASYVFYVSAATNSITGSTAETIALSVPIPANTLAVGKTMDVYWQVIRTSGTAGNITPRLRVSTSAAPSPVSGASLMALGVVMSTTTNSQNIQRTAIVKSLSSTITLNNTVQGASDFISTSGANTSTNIDTTVDQNLLFTIQNANSGDTSSLNYVKIVING